MHLCDGQYQPDIVVSLTHLRLSRCCKPTDVGAPRHHIAVIREIDPEADNRVCTIALTGARSQMEYCGALSVSKMPTRCQGTIQTVRPAAWYGHGIQQKLLTFRASERGQARRIVADIFAAAAREGVLVEWVSKPWEEEEGDVQLVWQSARN